MLINITNHPYDEWPEEQKRAANEQFGEIRDDPHPQIPPEADTDEIVRIVDGLLGQITDMAPDAAHVMGEHTFCFLMVCRLQQRGIACYAGTTSRSVIKMSDNEVRRTFGFVRFRRYPEMTAGKESINQRHGTK